MARRAGGGGRAVRERPAGALLLASVVAVAFLAAPTAVLLLRAWGAGGALRDPAVLAALRVSLLTTLASLALVVALGGPAAFLLARWRFRGRALVEALLDLPLVLPPVVAGLALLLAFGRNGPLGRGLALAGVELAFSPAAVVLAQAFVSAPLFVRAARAGFAGVDPDVEAAARVDGASRWAAFRFVTLPLAAPLLVEGAALAWARSLGEFGATVLFAGSLEGRTRTMPLLVYGALEGSLDAALAASAVLTLAAFATLAVLRALSARARDG